MVQTLKNMVNSSQKRILLNLSTWVLWFLSSFGQSISQLQRDTAQYL